jgi:hypothetical protein
MELSEILSKYELPEGDEITFEIPTGDVLRARPLRDASEILALEKRANQLHRVCTTRPHPEWKPYLPVDHQIVRLSVFCEACMIDPPMPFLECLKIAKTHGFVLLLIGTALLSKLGIVVGETEVEEIEAEKKDFERTTTGEPS